jgi:hypothetical protein
MIKTRAVQGRRELRFRRLRDVLADVEELARQGQVRALGNWTPAQIVQHVARFIRYSIDGFPFTAPAWLRPIGRMLRSRFLLRPWKPGIRLRGGSRAMEPDADVTWDAAVADLRREIGRVQAGARMTHKSPLFGALVHEEWEQLHCRHAELHFSFLVAGGSGGAGPEHQPG